MATPEDLNAPSTHAMERYLATATGLRTPQLARPMPGLPTLPDLKKIARDRRAAGQEVIDQSAGDIADVNQPLSDEFVAWVDEARDRLLADGHSEFRREPGTPYGFPGNYIQQFPFVTAELARSWGIRDTPYEVIQTISGRTVIDLAMRGLIARAEATGKSGRRALILDPMAWSGYRPLAAELDLALVHAPVVSGHGLNSTGEGLKEALAFARSQDLVPIGAITVMPSNPTGVGMTREELTEWVGTAADADLPALIDAFYSPLARQGHRAVVPMDHLERDLPPEVMAYLGLIVGETKVTSSQNKTGTVYWMAPDGHAEMAETIIEAGKKRMRATNAYPRPNEALVAYALHTFPQGIHAAMGPRYEALEGTRVAMRKVFDTHGLPMTIGDFFYGTAALVDSDGVTLIRDAEGRPVSDPREVCETMINRHGLVGAPGGMFSPAPEALAMVRLTAAVTLADVDKVGAIVAQMASEAQQHG